MRAWTDHRVVAPELGPGVRVRGVDAHLDREARVLVAERRDAERPGDLDEARLREGPEGLGVADVDERDLEVPDLADCADDDLTLLVVREHLEAWMVGRGLEVVDAQRGVGRLAAREPLGERADGEERVHER